MAMKTVVKRAAILTLLLCLLWAAFGITRSCLHKLREDDSATLLKLAALAALGCLIVGIDSFILGPKIGLFSSTLALGVAWLCVVPVGLLSIEWSRDVALVGWLVLSAGNAMMFTVFIAEALRNWSILEQVAVALAFVVETWFAMHYDAMVQDHVGIVLAMLAVQRAAQRGITSRSIDLWPGVQEVNAWSEEFQEQADFFAAACVSWSHNYDFTLRVERIYRMEGRGEYRSIARLQEAEEKNLSSRSLFHGTTREAAQSIAWSGFRLPDRPGMFGKGIYFADCPLKSWQYASANQGDSPEYCCNQGVGLMLLCKVNLGEARPAAKADTSLEGYNRNSWWAWLTSQRGAYDSIVGLDKTQGGVLRTPEYVIYDPRQASVEYIYEVSVPAE